MNHHARRQDADGQWGSAPAPSRLMVALAAAGLVIASYLTLAQVDVVAAWDPIFGDHDTRAVLDLTHPVPDAAAGVLAYAAELALLLARRARALLGLILIAGAMTSVALIVIQPTVAEHWCALCLGSAAISLALLALGRAEAAAFLCALRRPDRAARRIARSLSG
jgi:hypothetical protein